MVLLLEEVTQTQERDEEDQDQDRHEDAEDDHEDEQQTSREMRYMRDLISHQRREEIRPRQLSLLWRQRWLPEAHAAEVVDDIRPLPSA
jgi:hypothetical protein